MKTVKELAALSGVSIRTLHYYDALGLLHPDAVSEAGYRFYGETSIARLQQILFFRELGFPLKQIASLLDAADYNPDKALAAQKELLTAEIARKQALIQLIDETLAGGVTTFEAFDKKELNKMKRQYEKEVKERWGTTPQYAESLKKERTRTEAESAGQQAEADALFDGFASLVGTAPESAAVQQQVQRWRDHITNYYYDCTLPIFSSLAEMYIGDPRFQNTLDAHGAGTAQLLHDGILAYCAAHLVDAP